MKVKELIALLETLDQNSIVIVASDSEGNNFSALDEDYGGGYWDEEEYELFNEDEEEILDENGDVESIYSPAIVLYPER